MIVIIQATSRRVFSNTSVYNLNFVFLNFVSYFPSWAFSIVRENVSLALWKGSWTEGCHRGSVALGVGIYFDDLLGVIVIDQTFELDALSGISLGVNTMLLFQEFLKDSALDDQLHEIKFLVKHFSTLFVHFG